MNSNETLLERQRRALWIKVAIAVARAEGTSDKAAPGSWADKILEDFDERFPSEKETPKG